MTAAATVVNSPTLRVIKASPPAGSTMTIMVKADRREDLEGVKLNDAKLLAKQYAIKVGFHPRGLSDIPTIHPINDKDEVTDQVAVFGTEPVAGYVATFKFGAGAP